MKKTLKTKKKIENGKVTEEKIEDYKFPNGNREITRTVNQDGRIQTHKYSLGPGQELPREIAY